MKKLVTKETIAEVNEMLKHPNVSFDSCEIGADFKVRLGNVVIRKTGPTSVIELDPLVRKETFAQWKRDVGRYLSRDLSHGVYVNLYELKTPEKKALLRKVPENELPDMRAEGFDHVYIGDYHYTIIKVVPLSARYDESDDNTESEDFTQYSYISEFDKSDGMTEEEGMQQGMPLFTDDDMSPIGQSEPEEMIADEEQDD